MHKTLQQSATWLLQSAQDVSTIDDPKARQAAQVGWLKSAPLKALHPLRWQLCLATPDRLAVLSLTEGFGHTCVADTKPLLHQVCAQPEQLTALTWACFAKPDSRGCDDSYILVGTSSGCLLVLSEDGDLLHRQRLHATALTAITLRAAGQHAHDSSEDATICFEDAVARISSWELQSVVAFRKKDGPSGKWPVLGYNKWDTSRGAGPRSGALCWGPEEPGLYAVMASRDTDSHLLLLTVGRSPPVAAFRAKEHATQGTLALLNDAAGNVVAGVAGLARAAVLGREGGFRAAATAGLRSWLQRGVPPSARGVDRTTPPGTPPNEAKEEAPPAGEPAALWRSFRDDARAITSMVPCPRGLLAAAADSLGRVLLIDCPTATVLRVFKGYRHAQCAWVALQLPPGFRSARTLADLAPGAHAHGKNDDGNSTEKERLFPHLDLGKLRLQSGKGSKGRHTESGVCRPQARGFGAEDAAERQVFLAMHAPWRGVIDVWATAHGPKLCSLRAGPECCMLAAPPMFGRAQQPAHAGGPCEAPGTARSGWVLNCASGELWSIEDAVMAALT